MIVATSHRNIQRSVWSYRHIAFKGIIYCSVKLSDSPIWFHRVYWRSIHICGNQVWSKLVHSCFISTYAPHSFSRSIRALAIKNGSDHGNLLDNRSMPRHLILCGPLKSRRLEYINKAVSCYNLLRRTRLPPWFSGSCWWRCFDEVEQIEKEDMCVVNISMVLCKHRVNYICLILLHL